MNNLTCRCGHTHEQHGKSYSLNYTAGACGVKGCSCIGFVIHPAHEPTPPVSNEFVKEGCEQFTAGEATVPDETWSVFNNGGDDGMGNTQGNIVVSPTKCLSMIPLQICEAVVKYHNAAVRNLLHYIATLRWTLEAHRLVEKGQERVSELESRDPTQWRCPRCGAKHSCFMAGMDPVSVPLASSLGSSHASGVESKETSPSCARLKGEGEVIPPVLDAIGIAARELQKFAPMSFAIDVLDQARISLESMVRVSSGEGEAPSGGNTDAARRVAPEETGELLHYINATPLLLSLLYDIDLLPEQLKRRSREWGRMLIIAEHFRHEANADLHEKIEQLVSKYQTKWADTIPTKGQREDVLHGLHFGIGEFVVDLKELLAVATTREAESLPVSVAATLQGLRGESSR